MRAKAKRDSDFRTKLLSYLSSVFLENLPAQASDEQGLGTGSQAFKPFIDPDSPYFADEMAIDLYDLVLARNMHSSRHFPTCFKYNSNKCRMRFPRKLISETRMDLETGLIEVYRDHAWLNAYNPWIMTMLRSNHDCQFLFSQIHSLAIIHYVMKYITKREQAVHAKLTIAAAVRRDMNLRQQSPDMYNDSGKTMLVKVCNKMESHREIGMAEAISHLLDIPDHYTDATFVNLQTKGLLSYVDRYFPISQSEELNHGNRNIATIVAHDEQDVEFDTTLTIDPGSSDRTSIFTLVSAFDDYCFRGPHLMEACLYDYATLVYKAKGLSGVSFLEQHPQSETQSQHIRRLSACHSIPIPNLLGRILFVRPDSPDSKVVNEYYALVSLLFISWSISNPPNPQRVAWKDWYESQELLLSPRVHRLIDNLALLHKSRAEAEFDRLQRAVQEGNDESTDPNIMIHDSDAEMYGDNRDSDDDDQEWDKNGILSLAHRIDDQLYTMEGIDSSWDFGYLRHETEADLPLDEISANGVCHSSISLRELSSLLECQTRQASTENEGPDFSNDSLNRFPQSGTISQVYLTDRSDIETRIAETVAEFQLNKKQSLAFKIVAHHSMSLDLNPSFHFSELGPNNQLLMGIFGEGGTGKSRVIDAICKWFSDLDRKDEILITATTGAAAIKVNGQTLHSALGIRKERNRTKSAVSARIRSLWRNRRYLIIDEVSMLDSSIMRSLHEQLTKIRSKPQMGFGGVNIIFVGDFLQLPSVTGSDIYIPDKRQTEQAFLLWRQLNAVVILDAQMRQAEDTIYAELLSRLRLRCPTQEDINLLNSRIGLAIPEEMNDSELRYIVRRNPLRSSINGIRIKQMAQEQGVDITYCLAKVLHKSPNISNETIYKIRQQSKYDSQDAILALIPGCPLMVTQNQNSEIGLVNGGIVEFAGFHGDEVLWDSGDGKVLHPPPYMLVRIVEGPGSDVQLPNLAKGVVPLTPVKFTVNEKGRSVTLLQFPVTLGYAITDYKCQGSTYKNMLVLDIRRPGDGNSPAASAYVQLSRARSLSQVYILRSFDGRELKVPLSDHLNAELEWEKMMDEKTMKTFGHL
jgi:PIF1-like helicase